jgi:molybdopterin adenylyltransferase
MSQTLEIVSVNLSEEKGTVKHPVAEVMVDSQGIQGDAHAGPGNRQVSLLGEESIARFARQVGRELRPGDFGENLTVRGMDTAGVALLDRFCFREVELEVTQIGKECHGRGCSIFREIGQCVMPVEGVFSRVVQGGIIQPGESGRQIAKQFRFLVITLSDRAAAGQYEDRSGPRLKAVLQDAWAKKPRPAEIETMLIPDDPVQLRQLLLKAKGRGLDAVFTTGGTGVGPRDATPETAAGVCDRIIPGIMEYIRVKSGAKHPNALLSRSIAGLAGRTLIYTLPGSVRAVEEYMEEILKTIEHTMFMVHGLDVH